MGWEDVGQGGGGDFLKIEPGSKVRLHVLSEEPHSYWQYFNDKIQRGVVVPDGYDAGNEKLRRQHALAIFNMDAKEAKVWLMGNRVAGEIKNIFDNYQGLSTIDLIVSRTGTGKSTKYAVVPVPTKFQDSWLEGLTIPEPTEIKALQPAEDDVIQALMAGQDPSADFQEPAAEETAQAETPAEETAAPEESFEEAAEEPAPKAVVKPQAKPAVKPIAAKPAATGGDPRAPYIRAITHKLMTTPKFKDPKVRIALIKRISKAKSAVSQLSLDELKKLQPLVK